MPPTTDQSSHSRSRSRSRGKRRRGKSSSSERSRSRDDKRSAERGGIRRGSRGGNASRTRRSRSRSRSNGRSRRSRSNKRGRRYRSRSRSRGRARGRPRRTSRSGSRSRRRNSSGRARSGSKRGSGENGRSGAEGARRRAKEVEQSIGMGQINPARLAMIQRSGGDAASGGTDGSKRNYRVREDRDRREDRERRPYNTGPMPQLHSIQQGTVRAVKPFGCFVEMQGFRKHGMIHISLLSSRRVENVEDVVSMGESVWVKVVGVEADKIALSLKDVDQGSGRDLDPSHDTAAMQGARGRGGAGRDAGDSNDLPALYSIHKGAVASIRDFGAFIALPGFRSHGLVHISQLASFKVNSVDEVLAEGDVNVWVKVIDVDEKGKVSLSMRSVNQSTGQDQDPQHEEAMRQQERRKNPFDAQSKRGPITLNAVLNTVCPQCGGKGHLKSECMVAKGTKYDLLEEPDEDGAPAQAGNRAGVATGANDTPVGKRKKRKRSRSTDPVVNIEQAMLILAKAKAKAKRKKQKKKEKKKKKGKKKKKSKKKKGKERRSKRSGDDSSSDESSNGDSSSR